MKNQSRGMGLYLVFAALLVLGFVYLSNRTADQDSYTWQQLQEDLEEENVAAAKISQEQADPYGACVRVTEKREKHQLVVTDVNEVEELFKSENMTSYQIEDVPRENTMMTTLLPVILTGVMMFVLILFMTRSMGGGGGSNAKMMNFGKSRARMSTDKDKQVTFQNVAGLEEREGRSGRDCGFLKRTAEVHPGGSQNPQRCDSGGPSRNR